MKQLGSIQKQIEKNKNSEHVQNLEIVEVVLIYCNVVNNNYQQTPKLLFTFVPDKMFGQLITISPHPLIMLNTTNTEFSYIEVWFTN